MSFLLGDHTEFVMLIRADDAEEADEGAQVILNQFPAMDNCVVKIDGQVATGEYRAIVGIWWS